eukprot:3404853-Rhodomonas_salina.3
MIIASGLAGDELEIGQGGLQPELAVATLICIAARGNPYPNLNLRLFLTSLCGAATRPNKDNFEV